MVSLISLQNKKHHRNSDALLWISVLTQFIISTALILFTTENYYKSGNEGINIYLYKKINQRPLNVVWNYGQIRTLSQK